MLKLQPTVLLVDDNETFRSLVCDIFQLMRPGWRIIEASNGAEAVELAQTMLPDLILLDINMPVMNGYDATLRLRAEPKTSAVPVLLMTSEDADDPLVTRLRTLVHGILFKPFSLRDLERSLDRLVPLPEKEIRSRPLVGRPVLEAV
jgi:CheY-like chemotaxis protein